jgi:hypothetical protein
MRLDACVCQQLEGARETRAVERQHLHAREGDAPIGLSADEQARARAEPERRMPRARHGERLYLTRETTQRRVEQLRAAEQPASLCLHAARQHQRLPELTERGVRASLARS